MIDPDYALTAADAPSGRAFARNRVSGGSLISTGIVKDITLGAFSNGATAFAQDANAPRLGSDVSLNPDAWSFVIAMQHDVDGRDSSLIRSVDLSGTRRLHIQMSVTSQLILRDNDTDVRASATIAQGAPMIGVVTFSTARGINIFVNGVLAQSEPTQTDAITGGADAGASYFLRQVEGLVGMVGMFDIDLSSAEFAPQRDTITGFMMDKYGISVI